MNYSLSSELENNGLSKTCAEGISEFLSGCPDMNPNVPMNFSTSGNVGKINKGNLELNVSQGGSDVIARYNDHNNGFLFEYHLCEDVIPFLGASLLTEDGIIICEKMYEGCFKKFYDNDALSYVDDGVIVSRPFDIERNLSKKGIIPDKTEEFVKAGEYENAIKDLIERYKSIANENIKTL